MILVSPERLSAAIGCIYEAGYSPAMWESALADLGDLFHSSKACICKLGANSMAEEAVTTNPDPVYIRSFFEEHVAEPNELSKAISTVPIGSIFSDHALVGQSTLRRSRFWNEWMAPQDMYGSLSCKLPVSGPFTWVMDLQRGRNQASFTASDAALLGSLIPHLVRAVEISQKFRTAQVLASTFSQLPFGVIVIDGHMRVASVNAAAEAILIRRGSGLHSKSGCLFAADPQTMALLQKLVADACGADDDVNPGVGGELLVRGKSDGRNANLALSVGPLVDSAGEFPVIGRHAAIFIRGISFDLPEGFAEQIRIFFDLTPKEASLAASLASGMTLKEAADDARIRFSTARSHMEKILQKTGTRQQSQLVALLKSAQMFSPNSRT